MIQDIDGANALYRLVDAVEHGDILMANWTVTRKGGESFRLAYLVRAVTPGTFRVPAFYVEDMYDPAIQARGAMGRMTVHR